MCIPTTIKTLVDCPWNYANRSIVSKDYNAENAILKSLNVKNTKNTVSPELLIYPSTISTIFNCYLTYPTIETPHF